MNSWVLFGSWSVVLELSKRMTVSVHVGIICPLLCQGLFPNWRPVSHVALGVSLPHPPPPTPRGVFLPCGVRPGAANPIQKGLRDSSGHCEKTLSHTLSFLPPLPPLLEGIFWAFSSDWLEMVNFNYNQGFRSAIPSYCLS